LAGGTIATDISVGGSNVNLSTSALTVDDGAALADAHMYLDLIGADNYSFKIDDGSVTASVSINYTNTSASLELAASTIKNTLTSAGVTNFDASVVDGRIKITDQDSGSFTLKSFASTGDGKIAASNESGQGDAALLDDVTYGGSASSTSAGVAVSTVAHLEFSTNDRYSFTISDGTGSANISNIGIGAKSLSGITATTGANAVIEMKSAIENALKTAGLDDTIKVSTATVASSPDRIILTHNLGYEINIDNFKSEEDGILKVEAGNPTNATSTASSGMTKFLDDGGASRTVISGISVNTTANANSAIDVIDRALEDIAAERAKLGAITNRLDHTINNLGNIVVNTSASKSAIQDADFASETSNLTKSQILSQAATSMLAQANQSKQSILALLQG